MEEIRRMVKFVKRTWKEMSPGDKISFGTNNDKKCGQVFITKPKCG
jgi:hypothetical protein